MNEESDKNEFNRQPDGKFGPNNIANPKGRPVLDDKQRLQNKIVRDFIKEHRERMKEILPQVDDMVIARALKGDMTAAKEVYDRAMGKAIQPQAIAVKAELTLTQRIKQGRKQIIERYFNIVNKQSVQVPFTQNWVQNKIDSVREQLQREGKDVWLLILKARQEGCSAKVEADWLADSISIENLNCVVISHEKESTKRLLRRVHYYVETAKFKIETEKQSEYEISFPETNSWFYIGTAGARAFGRGDTIHRVHFSEWAFYQDDTVVDGILQSIPKGGEVVAESTANGFGNRFQVEWDRARKGESKFYPLFFSWADNPDYQIKDTILTEEEITTEEQILKDAFDLTIPQIAWRREKMKEFPNKEAFMQEYPITSDEAFIHTGTPAFDVLALKTYVTKPFVLGMFEDRGDEVRFMPNPQGWWRRWEIREAGQAYYGFCDPAEGLDPEEKGDSDYSVCELYDQNLKQVAELQRRLTSSETAKQFALAGRYYNQAYLGWERNSAGSAVSVVMKQVYQKNRCYEDEDGKVGWQTNVRSRKLMIDSLGEVITDHSIQIQSSHAVSEAISFILDNDGKYRAQRGTHDDTVIATAGVVQMWKRKPIKTESAVKKKLREERRAKREPNAYYEAN